MRRPVVLSGFMATGKSTVGQRLAARLGVPFVDTDTEVERVSGAPIPELWAREGEAAFRAREAAVAQSLLDGTPRVLAFGGGAVVDRDTRRRAIDGALVVTLTASPATIVARAGDVRDRPNLAAGGDPVARAGELLAARAEAYAECHVSVATDRRSPDAVVESIVEGITRDPLLVPLGLRSYSIDVCAGEPSRLSSAVTACAPSSLVVVTDAHVEAAQGAVISAALERTGLRAASVVLPPGEDHKTIASIARIWDAALASGIDRDALVVAVGGGVVGDLAGFAASSLLRGIRFLQVPTTLLSMVDSSVGGKTGFDHAAGKNLIGAFHQPSAVVVDLAHLSTLDARQRAAGLAEVAKVALATDPQLLERLERDAPSLAAGHLESLMPIVRAAIDAKIRIVRDDEREAGPRALLNVGHTVGHALEAYGEYDRWLHGEAVAIGTVIEMRATAALGHTPAFLVERAEALLRRLGLPTSASRAEIEAAWPFVASDKKRGRDAIRLPVITSPGVSRVERVPLSDLRAALLRVT
jgi:shikimate kinase/3-dehydroquinate synthase